MAARTIGLEIKIDGVSKTVTSIKELEGEIQNLQERLKGVAIGSDEFNRLQGELRAASGELEDFNRASEGISLDKQIEAVGKFTGGITSGFAAATAAAQLFGAEQKTQEQITQAATTAQNLLTVALGGRAIAETLVGARTLIQVASTKAATLATIAQTIATRGLTANLRILYATMLANPFGAAAAALLAVVGVIKLFGTELGKAEVQVRDVTNVITDEANELIIYQNIINSVNSTEQERLLAKEKLLKIVPELNKEFTKQNKLTEEGNILIQKRIERLGLEAQISDRVKQVAELRNRQYNLERGILSLADVEEAKRQGLLLTGEAAQKRRQEQLKETNRLLKAQEQALGDLIGKQAELGSVGTNLTKQQKTLTDSTLQEFEFRRRRIELLQEGIDKDLQSLLNKYQETALKLFRERPDRSMSLEVFLESSQALLKERELYEIERLNIVEKYKSDFESFIRIQLGQEEAAYRESQEKILKDAKRFLEEYNKNVKNAKIAEQSKRILDALTRQIDTNIFQKQLSFIIEQTKNAYDLDKQLGEDNLEEQIKLYDLEFKAFKDAQLKIFKEGATVQERLRILNGERRDLTNEEIKEIEEIVPKILNLYRIRLEELRKLNIERLKFNREITESEKFTIEVNLQSEKEYFEALLKLQETYKDDRKKLDTEVTKLDKVRKEVDLRNEQILVNDKIRIYEKYNKDLVDLNARRIQLEAILSGQLGLEQGVYAENIDDLQNELDRINNLVENVIDPVELEKLKNRALELQTLINNITNIKPIDENFSNLLGNIQTYLQVFSNSINTIGQLTQTQFTMQLELLESNYQKTLDGIVGDTEEANQKRIEAETIYQQKKKDIEKKARISSLQATLIQTLASAAQAVVSTLANPTLGPGAKAVIIGIESLLSLAQIQTIRNQIQQAQNLRRGGRIKEMGNGGMVFGASHEQGGVRFGNYELEGGESIINRQSSLNYGGLISSINMAGGGRPIINNVLDSRLVEVLAKGRQEPIRAYVFESDITRSQTINRKLEQLTTL